jgi:hypothetical protein
MSSYTEALPHPMADAIASSRAEFAVRPDAPVSYTLTLPGQRGPVLGTATTVAEAMIETATMRAAAGVGDARPPADPLCDRPDRTEVLVVARTGPGPDDEVAARLGWAIDRAAAGLERAAEIGCDAGWPLLHPAAYGATVLPTDDGVRAAVWTAARAGGTVAILAGCGTGGDPWTAAVAATIHRLRPASVRAAAASQLGRRPTPELCLALACTRTVVVDGIPADGSVAIGWLRAAAAASDGPARRGRGRLARAGRL